MHSAFLGYALRHSLPVLTELWAVTLALNRSVKSTYLSFAFFCSLIRKKWNLLTPNEFSFITNAIREFGLHSADPEELLEMYKMETGFRQMVIEAIMAIDPTRFSEFPLVEYLFSPKKHVGDHIGDVLEAMSGNPNLLFEAATLFSRFFFERLPLSMMEQFEIPPSIPEFERYIPSQIEVRPFVVVHCRVEITEQVLSFWEKHREYDSFLFFVIFHLGLTREQYGRLLAPLLDFSPSHPHFLHVEARRPSFLPTTDPSHLPSYGREFISLFISPNPPPLSLEQKGAIVDRLPRVFFNLLPKGFEIFGTEPIFDKRFPPVDESILAIQPVDQAALGGAKSVFRLSPSMTCQVLNLLFQTDSAVLCSYFNTQSVDAAFMDIAETIVEILGREQQLLKDPIRTMKSLLQRTSLTQFFAVAANESFLNAPCLRNVFVVFRMFSKEVEGSGDARLKEHWCDIQDILAERIHDERRRKLLLSGSVAEMLLYLDNN
jgi:hypothetical protein